MATRNEWDELQYYNKENQDDNVKNWDRKLNDTDANDDGDNNATAHFTACVALHNWACARSPVPCTFHHTHIGSSSSLARTPLTVIHMPSMCATSSPWTPLSTSQPSSCLSSFPPSSTSATSSSRSSTRRSWKTCATPPTTGVRAPTTSSTSPQVEGTNRCRMMFADSSTKRLISRQWFWDGVWRWTSFDNHRYTDNTVTCWVMTVSWWCWENVGMTHKSRGVITFVFMPTLTRLFLLVADASLRLCCFCLFVLHAWCSGSVGVDWCAIYVCLLVQGTRISIKAHTQIRVCFQPSLSYLFRPQHVVLNTSVSWQDRLWQIAAECDTHCELLDRWTILTSQKVIASQSSTHVITYTKYYI